MKTPSYCEVLISKPTDLAVCPVVTTKVAFPVRAWLTLRQLRTLSCQLIDWWWGKRMAENFRSRDTYQICDSSFCLNIIPSACRSSYFFRFWRILERNHTFFNHFKTAFVQKLRDIQSRRTCFTASSHLIAERRVTAPLGLISDFCGSFSAQIPFRRTRDNFAEINVRPKGVWLHFTLGWY